MLSERCARKLSARSYAVFELMQGMRQLKDVMCNPHAGVLDDRWRGAFALVRHTFSTPRGNRTPNPLIKRRNRPSAVLTCENAGQVQA
jgi:hypothetical protein